MPSENGATSSGQLRGFQVSHLVSFVAVSTALVGVLGGYFVNGYRLDLVERNVERIDTDGSRGLQLLRRDVDNIAREMARQTSCSLER